MSAKQSPVAENDGAGNLTGQSGLFRVPNSNAVPMTPAEQADVWCNGLQTGDISLAEIPLPAASLYLLGYQQGRASREPEISRLNFEADFWHFRFANPGINFYRYAENELWRVPA